VIDREGEPFLFDTSADSYLTRTREPLEREWLRSYLKRFPIQVSVITVVDRLRGYALVVGRCEPRRRRQWQAEREHNVLAGIPPADGSSAGGLVARGWPPSVRQRPRRRQVRWRFDILIAATALARRLPLLHNNPQDFETLRAVVERFAERFPGVGPLGLLSVRRLAS